MRAGHHIQLREGLLHPRRAAARRRDPGDEQEERAEGDRRPGPVTRG